MRVQVLGPLAVTVAGRDVRLTGRMERAVLAHLVLAEGRPVPVGLLVDALWPAAAPATARNAVQVKISRLRRCLGAEGDRLEYLPGAYRLRLGPGATDAERLTMLVSQGRAALAERDPARAATAFAEAVGLWRSEPLPELDDYPRVRAARERLTDSWWSAREGLAEARMSLPDVAGQVTAELRQMLVEEPLRPRPRLLLMTALEHAGRRADALAVYDAGRRLLAAETGLEPSEELRALFQRLLQAERTAAGRDSDAGRGSAPVPPNLLDTARWLRDEGDVDAALRVAVRAAWSWWSGGQRSAGRCLLDELLEQAAHQRVSQTLVLRAEAWAGALRLAALDGRPSFDRSQAALARLGLSRWDGRDALAAAVIAERLYQHGRHTDAARLVTAARGVFTRLDDDWGVSVCDIARARGLLLQGSIAAAERLAAARLARFDSPTDAGARLLALDVLGDAAQARGDLARSTSLHSQALATARRSGSPEGEARQLARLGTLAVLAGDEGAVDRLVSAVRFAESIDSAALVAFSRNGLGVALSCAGDPQAAEEQHRAALAWYASAPSQAGLAYTRARLATVLHARDSDRAHATARTSLAPALAARDPRGIAHSLEAVALTASDTALAAVSFGAAEELRRRAGAPLARPEAGPLQRRRQEWQHTSAAALPALLAEGAADPLRHARSLTTSR